MPSCLCSFQSDAALCVPDNPHCFLNASLRVTRERLCCSVSVRMSLLLHLLLLWILLRDCESQGYMGNSLDFAANFGNILYPVTRPANASRIFYGIMFDAGSTGTRIHVYTFIQKDPGEVFQCLFPKRFISCAVFFSNQLCEFIGLCFSLGLL